MRDWQIRWPGILEPNIRSPSRQMISLGSSSVAAVVVLAVVAGAAGVVTGEAGVAAGADGVATGSADVVAGGSCAAAIIGNRSAPAIVMEYR